VNVDFSLLHWLDGASPTWRRALVGGLLLLFLAGGLGMAWTRTPDTDEGVFASCAYEFGYHGRLATPMYRDFMPGSDRYMMYMMPLYFVQLGAWGRLFGFDFPILRVNSLLWGLLLIIAWGSIVHSVMRKNLSLVICMALLACNYDIVNLSSGRYDVMAAALAAAGVACYLRIRETSVARAVFVASCCITLACLTHPYGGFGAVAVALCVLFLDRDALSWRIVLLACLPFAAGLASWAIYLAQAPETFLAQIRVFTAGRLKYFWHPGNAIQSEIAVRWLQLFAGFRPGVPALMRLKVLILPALAAGLAGCVLSPELRKNRLLRPFLAAHLAFFLMLTFFEGERWYVYLIHALPLYFVILGIWLSHLVVSTRVVRWFALAVVACIALYSAATLVLRARINDYGNIFQPTLAFLKQHVDPSEPIVGPGEFSMGLGFPADYSADVQLRRFRKHTATRWIVVDSTRRAIWAGYAASAPGLFEYIQSVLKQFDLVFEARGPYRYYEVYRRRNP
jgi:hypothetical protein